MIGRLAATTPRSLAGHDFHAGAKAMRTRGLSSEGGVVSGYLTGLLISDDAQPFAFWFFGGTHLMFLGLDGADYSIAMGKLNQSGRFVLLFPNWRAPIFF